MKKKTVSSANNIWNKENFQMCDFGEKNKVLAIIKHFKNCIQWSWQRIIRGYSDCDKRNMYDYLQTLIPDMLQDLRDKRYGSPTHIDECNTDECGTVEYTVCHEEWNKILDCMIFLWRESNESTCTRKNPFEDQYSKASEEFTEIYGFSGEKLQTAAEIEFNRKYGDGAIPVHFMDELPEYKEISDKYFEEEQKLAEYRNTAKDEAIDLLKKHFFNLWD